MAKKYWVFKSFFGNACLWSHICWANPRHLLAYVALTRFPSFPPACLINCAKEEGGWGKTPPRARGEQRQSTPLQEKVGQGICRMFLAISTFRDQVIGTKISQLIRDVGPRKKPNKIVCFSFRWSRRRSGGKKRAFSSSSSSFLRPDFYPPSLFLASGEKESFVAAALVGRKWRERGGHDRSGGWVVGFLGGIPGKRKGKRGERGEGKN